MDDVKSLDSVEDRMRMIRLLLTAWEKTNPEQYLKWSEEGGGSIYTELIEFEASIGECWYAGYCRNNYPKIQHEYARKLELLAGPHGATLYKAMIARRQP